MKKKCGGCKKEKFLDNFSKDKSSRDGLSWYCKKCDTARNRIWRENNRKTFNSKQYRHMAKYPEKQRARGFVARALRTGKLKKTLCQTFGCKTSKVHAHHFDYSKPLEIIWLCVKHHEAIHHGNST